MKSRWLLNLAMLLVVGGIVLFLYLRPEPEVQTGPQSYAVSTVAAADITKVRIEFPAKAPVELEKRDQRWFLLQPYAARAGAAPVEQMLAILSAETNEKFAANDLARFGLDQPQFKLRLNQEEFSFGTINPLDGRQYVAYRDAVYLLPAFHAEVANTQIVELLDKRPVAAEDEIVGFDFSRLEQWEPTGLVVDIAQDWKVSIAEAKPVKQELDAWLEEEWKPLTATSVEPYKPDSRANHPSFLVKLKSGKTVRFDKIQESPELQLGRPDEGMLYHFPQDTGFVILNPPIGYRPK